MKRKDIFIRLMRYLGQQKKLLILSVICAVISTLLSLLIPRLSGQAVDICVGQENEFAGQLTNILVWIALMTALTTVSQYISCVINNRLCYRTSNQMRKDAFDKLSLLPIRSIESTKQGDILSRITNDTQQISDGLLIGLTQFFSGVTAILGTVAFMLSIDLAVGSCVIIATPLSFFAASFISKRTYRYFKRSNELKGEETSLINETLKNQKLVKAFAHEDAVKEDFTALNSEMETASRKAVFFSSLTNPVTRFANSVVYAIVAVAGAFSILAGRMTTGGLSCFLQYANQYTKPFNEISSVITELQNALSCAARVFELLDMKEEEPDRADAAEIVRSNGSFEMRGIHFSYDGKKSFISNLYLAGEKGKRIALVGKTGCGKTTLINLLMRFYEPDKGSIFLSGHDIRTITRKSLRHNWGMVLQDTWLRSGTVFENLTLGGEYTPERVREAAEKCHADPFIRRLPEGYDTFLSEDGGNLSQGQKQLLCITRVMLRDPDMLILDEATSSIDTRTEVYVQRAFEELMKGRTSIIVAHRLSTIMNADCIIVMDNGRIVESGTHDQLLAQGGEYARIYRAQYA